MKKVTPIICCILLIVVAFYSFAMADSRISVSLNIDFLGNLIFSKYDVDLYVNTQKVTTISHGKDYSGMFYAEKGTYTIYFYKPDNHSVYGKIDLDVKGDTQISCRISCHRDHINVSKVSIKMDESKDMETPISQPTPAATEAPVSATEKTESVNLTSTPQPVENQSTSLDRPIPSFNNESPSWLLSYNHLTDTSKKISMRSKKGDTTVLVGHCLPAGKYRIENRGTAPAQIKFYLEGVQQKDGNDVLIPSEKMAINLFSGEKTEFDLQNGEYIILADGSTDLYCEPASDEQI